MSLITEQEQGVAYKGIENPEVEDAVETIEGEEPEFPWRLTRGDRYDRIFEAVLDETGSELRANVVSGAEKIVDVLDGKGIDPEETAVMRSTDWDGVVQTLGGEELYPGIEQAWDTAPTGTNELREAVITARGMDYITDMVRNQLGWETPLLSPENGNLLVDEPEDVHIRENGYYLPREFSHIEENALTEFQGNLRRIAAENNLKLSTGRTLSPDQVTVSIEESDSTGLNGDGFYSGYEFDIEGFEKVLEDLAMIKEYEDPDIGPPEELENDSESIPVARRDDEFFFYDTPEANTLLNEAFQNLFPYTEIRYGETTEEDLFRLWEDEYTEPEVDIDDSAAYVEQAVMETENSLGQPLAIDVHDNGWINVYLPEEDHTVKEKAAQSIAEQFTGTDDALIFHMDDSATGLMDSENTLFFPKYGDESHQVAKERGTDYVAANNFTDYYLTVSESLYRMLEPEQHVEPR